MANLKVRYERDQIIKNNIRYIKDVDYKKGERRKALFKCHCGRVFEAIINNIKGGGTKSCGCIKRKYNFGFKHGEGNHSGYMYRLWASIKSRCFNKNVKAYDRYGGRGITMYQPWINDYLEFKNFILSELGERPGGYTLDRIDNNGDYEPENLRWADWKTQAKNRKIWQTHVAQKIKKLENRIQQLELLLSENNIDISHLIKL